MEMKPIIEDSEYVVLVHDSIGELCTVTTKTMSKQKVLDSVSGAMTTRLLGRALTKATANTKSGSTNKTRSKETYASPLSRPLRVSLSYQNRAEMEC